MTPGEQAEAARRLLGAPLADAAERSGHRLCYERNHDGSVTFIKARADAPFLGQYVQVVPMPGGPIMTPEAWAAHITDTCTNQGKVVAAVRAIMEDCARACWTGSLHPESARCGCGECTGRAAAADAIRARGEAPHA